MVLIMSFQQEKNKTTSIKDVLTISVPIILAIFGYLLAIEPRLAILEDHDMVTKTHETRINSLEEFKAAGPRFTGTAAEKAFSKLQAEQHSLNNAFSKLSSSVVRNEAKLDLIINKLNK